MKGEKLGRLIFNTGDREEIVRRGFEFPLETRIGLSQIIKKAKKEDGVNITPNVNLHIDMQSNSHDPRCANLYTARFCYCSTPDDMEAFFFYLGARNAQACSYIWPIIWYTMKEDNVKNPPFNYQPATPLVIDLFTPCDKFDAMAYLYKSNCYDFCSRLGWALLYPDCIKI